MARRSRHIGAFAKGFADSFLAAYKLAMTKELNEARINFFNARADAARRGKGTGLNDPALQAAMADESAHFGEGAGTGGASDSGRGVAGHYADPELDTYFDKAMTDRGIDPTVARRVFNGESGFNTLERTGDGGSSFGPFQYHFGGMNAAMPHAGMGDDFLKATGIDIRKPGMLENKDVQKKLIDFTADRAATHGWGDWNAAKNQGIGRFAGIGKKTNAPEADDKAIVKGTDANKPTKLATAESEMVPAPGGGFRIPGADPASTGAGQPGGAPPPGSAIPRDLSSDQGPGAGAAPAPPGTPQPWPTGDEPPYGGHSTNYGPPRAPLPGPPQRTGAPPNVGITPSSAPEPVSTVNAVRPEPPVPVGTINPNTDRSPINAPLPPPRPSEVANAPAVNAQPVSATHAIPSTPAQDPRFTQVDRPNQNPNVRGQPQQMTALDLSHLWGPNPPVADRAPAPPGPPPPIAVRPRDEAFEVGTPDMAGISFSAKGGPITQRVSLAKGGAIPSRPTMNLAAGGASAYPSYTPVAPVTTGIQGNTLAADQYMNSLPGMQSVDLTNPSRAYYTSYGPGSINGAGGQALAANFGRMTPDQQKQYNDMIAGKWQPPAAAPAAAPALAAPAPAPVITPPSVQNITTYQGTPSDPSGVNTIDPTSTTSTGIPKVPTTIDPNTIDPNKIGTTGSGSATDSTGGTNYSVDEKDKTKQILSAKGGAIPAKATMGFAAGGGTYAGQSPGIQYLMSPNYIGPTPQGGWAGSTTYDKLAPNQQAWADTQKGLLGQAHTAAQKDAAYWGGGGTSMTGPTDTMQYWNQVTAMPDAIWPTAAPAAPTPLNQPPPSVQNIVSGADLQSTINTLDPTSTTSTGTPKVPNTVDPNKIGTTGSGSPTDSFGGTNYSVDDKDTTKQILSAKGGPITRRVTGYDDGGGVSPSFVGAPPGSTGGGPPPPIYYNPATYAAAGAPVGKGVSATNAGTMGAGAIPSLPMARGGVVGLDDGGTVAPTDDYDPMLASDMAAADTTPQAPAAPMTDKDPGFYVMPDQIASAAPPPPDPSTPQIKDDQGNPSRGLIGAISDGLHWLGDHLGLVGGAQAHPAIAHDPQTQDARQKFVGNHPDGATYLTHQNMQELSDIADPGHQLEGGYRHIAALEAGYKFALSRGDDATASRLAASFLHYSVLTSQNLSAEAQKALYNGNIQDAVDKTNQAIAAIPDGRNIHVTLNPDGKTVTVTGSDLNGQQLWQKYGSAATILEHATSLGRTGKLQWDALESQAAKYDSTFATMAKNRQGNVTDEAKERHQQELWQHQQDVLDQKQKAKEDAATASEERVNKAFAPAIPPSPVTPRVTPVSAPAAPPPASGGTQTATSPPTADENQGQGPTVANATGLPSQPSPANLPATDAQAVAEYQRRYNLVADQVIKQVGAEPQPPSPPDWSQLQSGDRPMAVARHNADMKAYDDAHKAWQTRVSEGIAGEMKDIGAERSDAAAITRDEATATRQREQQERTQTYNEEAPLTPQQRQETYKGSNPIEATASLPRYAVYDSSGALDPVKSAQALGKAYDLPPPGGGAVTGGLQRATTVANVAEDAATWNPEMGTGSVHDLVDGLARGVYTITGRPTPVTRHGQPLDQFIVHQTQDKSDPGVTLYLPKQSGYNIVRIRKEFEDAKPKGTSSALPSAPQAPAFPGVTPGAPPPQGGFNRPAMPPSPRAQWWMDRALGRGQPTGQSRGFP